MLATAAILALGAPLTAHALALGAIQVKSVLGEPLRAEVEVPEISSAEASTFQATLGTPQEFQAAGVDYNPALRGARVTLDHRSNGQAYLRVEGQQPVNEPFLGLVIDANWADGHVVRDYTLLIDPRSQPASSAPPQSLPQTSAPPAPPAPPPSAQRSPGSGAASGSTSSGQGEQISVQRGDTAASIAQAHPVDGVSLDQMLVAMLRSNPQAFIRGNVNLIRAGSVVNMPNADQATAVSSTAARRMVVAQSRNFQAYRQGLAGTTARGSAIASGKRRSTTGRVQAQVQDTGSAPTPQDRLTLSRGKGASGATAAARRAETRVARSRQAQDQATREAELRRNINELSQLATNGESAGTAATTPASQLATPAINMPPPVPVNTASASPPDASASTPVSAQQAASDTAATASVASSATASSPRPARRTAPPPPPPEPSIWDTLQDNLGYIGGLALALLALGGGYYTYRNRRRTKKSARDSSSFSESKFSPDSFFGNSGGQRIDTRENSTDANSSMTYSPSQLEAAGDVDPISEADVYLAYGRDAQAEEILKEALRTYPGRASIYAKLAEIYAKRHDSHLLSALATEAYRVTRGKGHEWQVIAHLGRELDPGNTLYQSSGAAPSASGPQTAFGADTEIQAPDFHAPVQRATNPEPARDAAPAMPSAPTQASPFHSTGVVGIASGAVDYVPTTPATASAPLHAETVNFAPPAPTAKPASSSGMMEFDMNSMPAGLTAKSGGSSGKPGAAPLSEDPMATKFALAQEFHAIGDNEGARKLAREVAAEASGTLKIQAVRLLTELG